ncbi:unnamed protein product [Ilex paraguariensis]|uniref:Uncharacterized protein n=1 Tax=Ilex paraguariensis TaxID=185542 RepID=A0ABC8QN57_9AQUA
MSSVIEEDAGPSSKVGSSDVPSGLLHVRESDRNPTLHTYKEAFAGHKVVNVDTRDRLHWHKCWRRRTTAVNESESLSDIDDSEVSVVIGILYEFLSSSAKLVF